MRGGGFSSHMCPAPFPSPRPHDSHHLRKVLPQSLALASQPLDTPFPSTLQGISAPGKVHSKAKLTFGIGQRLHLKWQSKNVCLGSGRDEFTVQTMCCSSKGP